jgi:hypothetical protein
MTPQHLSDEAVAAFADGVLSGSARERAARHIDSCAECRLAVKVQREAASALRTAPAPALPTGLMEKLRTVPLTTPITTLPTAVAPDGSTMLATFAPMAALVPDPARTAKHRFRPYLTAAALMGAAGALVAGSVASGPEPAQPGHGHLVQRVGSQLGVEPVNVFRQSNP